MLGPRDVGGIEVYPDANTAPIQYSQGTCGTVLVWTKTVIPPPNGARR
jgi:hypothetical protein